MASILENELEIVSVSCRFPNPSLVEKIAQVERRGWNQGGGGRKSRRKERWEEGESEERKRTVDAEGFCDWNEECTINAECFSDADLPFDRTIPEFAVAQMVLFSSFFVLFFLVFFFFFSSLSFPFCWLEHKKRV